MSRSHLYKPIQDAQGNLRVGAQVRVFAPGSATLTTVPLYEADTGTAQKNKIFTTSTGIIDFYTEEPARFRIGVKVGDEPEVFFENVDCLEPPVVAAEPDYGGGTFMMRVVSNTPQRNESILRYEIPAEQAYIYGATDNNGRPGTGYWRLHRSNVAARIDADSEITVEVYSPWVEPVEPQTGYFAFLIVTLLADANGVMTTPRQSFAVSQEVGFDLSGEDGTPIILGSNHGAIDPALFEWDGTTLIVKATGLYDIYCTAIGRPTALS